MKFLVYRGVFLVNPSVYKKEKEKRKKWSTKEVCSSYVSQKNLREIIIARRVKFGVFWRVSSELEFWGWKSELSNSFFSSFAGWIDYPMLLTFEIIESTIHHLSFVIIQGVDLSFWSLPFGSLPPLNNNIKIKITTTTVTNYKYTVFNFPLHYYNLQTNKFKYIKSSHFNHQYIYFPKKPLYWRYTNLALHSYSIYTWVTIPMILV